MDQWNTIMVMDIQKEWECTVKGEMVNEGGNAIFGCGSVEIHEVEGGRGGERAYSKTKGEV